jgi:hypothetical protein
LAPVSRGPAPPLLAVSAAWGIFWGAWGALIPEVKEQLSASTADLGLALVAVPVGAIPAMALTGRLARGRERAGLAMSTGVFALSVAALALVATPLSLGVVLFAVGVTSGALDVCLNLATARAERDTGRRLFQPVHAAFPIAVVGAAPGAGVARQLGAPLPAVLLTVAALVAVAAMAALRLPPTLPGRTSTRTGTEGPAVAGHSRAGLRAALGLGALGACVLAVENAVEQWSAVLLEDFRAASPVVASTGPATYMLALTAGRLLAQAMPALSTRVIVAVGGAGGGAGIVLAGVAPSAAAALAGFGLAGLAFGPLLPALLSRGAAADPSGGAVSVVTTVSYAGFVASPLIVAGLTTWMTLPSAMACLGVLVLPLLAAACAGRSGEAVAGGTSTRPDAPPADISRRGPAAPG